MNAPFISLKLVMASLAGAVLVVGCDKPDPAPAPAPPAPVAAVPALPDAAPAIPANPPPALTGEAAMEAFKTEVKSIKAFIESNQNSADETTALKNLRELIKRAAAVPTEGLPEDLATAYQAMNGVMQRVQATMDDLPVPMEQFQAYMIEEKAKGGAAAAEVTAKRAAFDAAMKAHEEDGKAASAKLREVGAKYGIEALELGGQ